MCGIGGILRVWPSEQRELALRTPHDQSIPEHWLDVIDDAIKHRGPDGQGRFRDRTIRADGCVVDVALVHRRLSIIDHAGGHQPMVLRIPRAQRAPSASSGTSNTAPPEPKNTPGRLLTPEELTAHNRRILAEGHSAQFSQNHDHIAVVFNGCIYNHRELRSELQRAGHVFHTDHSDTEVLVHGWREWGEGLPRRLDAMFAIAAWDGRHARAHLMRDFAGEKPLLYTQVATANSQEELHAFASSAAPLARFVRLWDDERPPQQLGVHPYGLTQWIGFGADDWLPIESLLEVQPGSRVSLATGIEPDTETYPPVVDVRNREYWGEIYKPRSKHLSSGELDSLVRRGVASRLEADTELGCFLSGGVDSSLVSAIAIRELGRLKTFCVRVPTRGMDESVAAASVAAHIGATHATIDISPDPAQDLQMLVHQLGLPFGDSSLLPQFWVSRAARQHVRVVIGGDAGDELFGGYRRQGAYLAADRYSDVVKALPSRALDLLVGCVPGRRRDELCRLMDALRFGYPELRRLFSRAQVRELMHGVPDFGSHPASDPLADDFCTYLATDLLRKTDTAAMSVSLELRCPLLARSVVNAAMSASLDSLMPHNQRKGLLRQVARKYLPAEIVDRPKMGFAIPIGEWFRTDYGGLRTMLLDHLNSSEPFGPPSLGIDLNRKYIQQMLDEHLGTGMSGRVTRDHSQRLYMLLVLSIWAKWCGSLSK